MQALENRTLDSKREMDIMSALDELKSMSSRHERVDTEAALAALKRSAAEEGEPEIDLDEEDEAAIRQMILQQQEGSTRRYCPPWTLSQGDCLFEYGRLLKKGFCILSCCLDCKPPKFRNVVFSVRPSILISFLKEKKRWPKESKHLSQSQKHL